MFNVGGGEMMVVFLVALLVLGPEQLPKAMRTFGNVMAEIRKVSGGFQSEMRKAMDAVDVRGDLQNSIDSFKPQSSGGPSTRTSTQAASPTDGDVTEVVARNDSAVESTAEARATAVDPVESRPQVDPADRAAG